MASEITKKKYCFKPNLGPDWHLGKGSSHLIPDGKDHVSESVQSLRIKPSTETVLW